MNEEICTMDKLRAIQNGRIMCLTVEEMRTVKQFDRSNSLRSQPIEPSVDGPVIEYRCWLEFNDAQ